MDGQENKNTAMNRGEEEQTIFDADTPIAPPTEVKEEENQSGKEEYVWEKFSRLEKKAGTLYVLSIIAIFSGIMSTFSCCCLLGLIYSAVIMILDIVNLSDLNRLIRLGEFSDFELIRVKDLKKKMRLSLIFSILGILINVILTLLITLAPFLGYIRLI